MQSQQDIVGYKTIHGVQIHVERHVIGKDELISGPECTGTTLLDLCLTLKCNTN